MAAVGSLSRVDSHVVLQVALTGDVFATYVTVKVPFAVMWLAFVRLEVPCKHWLFGEYVVAYVASVQGGTGLLLRVLWILCRRLLWLSAFLRCSTVFQLLHCFDEFFRQGVPVVAVLCGRLLLRPIDPEFLLLLPVLLLLLILPGGSRLVLARTRATLLQFRGDLLHRNQCSLLFAICKDGDRNASHSQSTVCMTVTVRHR